MKWIRIGVAWVALGGGVGAALAQNLVGVWRCGETYTNRPPQTHTPPCQRLDGPGVTVVPAWPRPPVPVGPSVPAGKEPLPPGPTVPRRGEEVRLVLQTEWRLAQQRLATLQAEQRHARDAASAQHLQEQVRHAEADVAALRRELARLEAGQEKK